MSVAGHGQNHTSWLTITTKVTITRYIDGTPTSKVTPVTIRCIRPSHHGHTSQYHGHEWMTHIFSFIVNWPPHSWDEAFSDSDLKTPRSRSGGWSKGKVIQSVQYHINSLHFHFTSIRPTIPEMELFRNSTLNIRGQDHEWEQRSRSHIVPSIQRIHFLFVSHQSDRPFLRYRQNSVWP